MVVFTDRLTVVDRPDGKRSINQYDVGEEIGHGTSSTAVSAVDKETGAHRALKIFSKSVLRKQRDASSRGINLSPGNDRAQVEVECLTLLAERPHPHIISLYEVIDQPDRDKLILALDLGDLGELLEWQNESSSYLCRWSSPSNPPWALPEDCAKRCFRQLALAIRHLHKTAMICHRDVKPGNCLIRKDDSGSPHLLLADFGVAERFDDTASPPTYTDTVGTYPFIPPEACSGDEYDGRLADIWAMGVTLYAMVFSRLPFYSSNLHQLFQMIEHDPLVLPASVDGPVLDLLSRILEKDPVQRLSVEEILTHPWLETQCP